MIRLEGVAARRRPLALASVTASWDAGVHSLVGTRADGGPLLLAVVAGATRARSGSVTVLGGPPGCPEARAQTARVPIDVALPDALRVDEALDLAATVRGEPARPAGDRLAALGVEALTRRTVRSLARPEARAVALAEAITSSRVRVLLVEEPFVAMDPRACARLTERLRERGRDGCAVLIDTASPRDAAEVACDHLLLSGGAVVGAALSIEELGVAGPAGASIRIVARDPAGGRAIGSALAGDADVRSVEHEGVAVVARGPSATRLAEAAERAIVACALDVAEIRLDPPSLTDARGAFPRRAQAARPGRPAAPPSEAP